MICFRDMSFCSVSYKCKKEKGCFRAITPDILREAEEWWGKPGAPIAMMAFKECLEEKQDAS